MWDTQNYCALQEDNFSKYYDYNNIKGRYELLIFIKVLDVRQYIFLIRFDDAKKFLKKWKKSVCVILGFFNLFS